MVVNTKRNPRQIKEFEVATKPLFQKKFGRHNLLPHHIYALCWLRIQEDFLFVKCDNNLGPIIVERGVYIERVCRYHLYQKYTYLYLTPALSASKMSTLKLKVGAWIKSHSKQLTSMEKRFLTTNLQGNVDPLPWLYGMIVIHKTLWTMIPMISLTGILMQPIGV